MALAVLLGQEKPRVFKLQASWNQAEASHFMYLCQLRAMNEMQNNGNEKHVAVRLNRLLNVKLR